MRQELYWLAGNDAHALWILDNLLDCYENETQVDLSNLRAHCALVTADKDAQLDFICVNLPTYIGEWAQALDESDVRLWAVEILAALHTLRTGELACRTCLDIAHRVDQIRSRRPFSIDCQVCSDAWVHATVSPRTPILRAVS
jgi:hypothetical protein